MRMHVQRFTAMGGPCSLQLYAPELRAAQEAASAAEAEVRRIECKYSRYRGDSIIGRINASAGVASGVDVDAETAALLDYAGTVYAQSDGLFDVTSGVLRRAWDFRAERIPGAEELAALLPLIGWPQVVWQAPRLVLPLAGMELDFGGFGKEYAVDCATAVLMAKGIRHGLVELGGDIRVVGPHSDGSPWRVGVRNPRAPDQAIATVELGGGAIASSGDYERYFERDGQRYCHILDPRTGWPVQGLAGISVLADHCLIAGTATTVAMLKGEGGAAWLQELGLPWLAVDQQGGLSGSIATV